MMTNILPFVSNISSIYRQNIVPEILLTYFLGPLYSIGIVIIENVMKVWLGQLDNFINYTLILKLINIFIIYIVFKIYSYLIGNKKMVNRYRDCIAMLFISSTLLAIFSKFIANNIYGMIDEYSYVNSFYNYISVSNIRNSIEIYFSSTIMALILIVIINVISKRGKENEIQ